MYDYKVIFDIHIENNAIEEKVSSAKERIKQLQDVQNTLTQQWQNVANAQAKYYNQKYKFKFYSVEDLIMLLAKNLKQKKLRKKLSNKLLELFRIQESIDKQTYHFNLSTIYKIYSVFYAFLLKSYKYRQNNDFILKYFALELINKKQEWKIKKILQKRKRKRILYYKVE